jgi:GH24 family phage-related lysozyme (muramidase)/uncharacterized protein YvpB
MPWINPIADTKLKLRPIDSAQLGVNEIQSRRAGDRLGIVAIRKADNNHWQVRLAGDLTIGGQKVRELYLWPPHWDGAASALLQTAEATTAKVIAQNYGSAKAIPGGVVLGVPYRSQRDNSNNPDGSCNVTSAAMCLEYWGIAENEGKQLEDEMYEWLINKGLSRHDPIDLKKAIEAFGCSDNFTTRAQIEQIKEALRNGIPVVVHGWFSTSGHIIVLIGYDEKGFLVHDPYGEWTAGGYLNKSGKALHYSYGLIERKCLPDGGCWAHFVTRPGVSQGKAVAAYAPKKYRPQEFRLNSVAIAVKKSFEGLELEAYPCSRGVPTIGIGTTVYPNGQPVRMGDTCTEAQAYEYFDYDSNRFMKALRRLVDVPLTGLQIAALTSFIYNVGEGSEADPDEPGFAGSTLRKRINANAPSEEIQAQFRRWTNDNTPGLIARREVECALWRGEKDWEKYR